MALSLLSPGSVDHGNLDLSFFYSFHLKTKILDAKIKTEVQEHFLIPIENN